MYANAYRKIDREKVLCLIFVLTGLALFYSFSWIDILATSEHGMNVWTCLVEGKLSGFYQYNSNFGEVNSLMFHVEQLGAYYDFPIYIIFAIWNFPIWILRTCLSINVFQCFLCVIWMKSIILVFIVGTVLILQKIGDLSEFSAEENRLMKIIFLTSGHIFSVIVMIGQYDIIPIFFMLAGTYFYLKRNRKMFLLFFIIAIPLKMFSFFFFLALVLYDEKNLIRIMGMVILPILPVILTRHFIPFAEISNDILIPAVLMSNKLNLSVAPVPIFILPMGITYIICYFKKKPENGTTVRNDIIYAGFLVYAILFAGCSAYPYWIIYILPFATLLFAMRGRAYLRVNILLEMGMAVSYTIAQMFKVPDCFGNTIVGDMLIPVILGKRGTEFPKRNISDYIWILTDRVSILDENSILSIATGVFIVCLVCFAVINCPTFNIEKHGIIKSETEEKPLMLFRIVTGYALCILPIGLYLAAVY